MIRMTRREFVRLVRRAYTQAYRRATPRIQEALSGIDVVVEEWPSEDDLELVEEEGATLLGLYSGIPLTQREGGPGAGETPERIVIYRQPILRACSTRSQAEREIRITLWHELGHYLGMGEQDLERLGYG